MGGNSREGSELTVVRTSADLPPTLAEAKFSWWRSLVPLACGLGIVGLCLVQGRPNASSEPGVVMSLPYKVAQFWGRKEGASVAEKLVLPPDTEIERKVYTDLDQDSIQCTIVLSGVERRSIHRPEICLPGQGWIIRSSSDVPITLQSGKKMYVKQLLLDRDVVVGPGVTRKVQSVFYYWFVGKKITTPEHYIRVFYSSWDLIAHNVNHRWAYVSATSLVTNTIRSDGKTVEQTEEILKNFIRDVVPSFQISEMSPDALKEAGISN